MEEEKDITKTIDYLESRIEHQKTEINLLLKQNKELKEINEKFEFKMYKLNAQKFDLSNLVSARYEKLFKYACLELACLYICGCVPKYADDETKEKIGRKAKEIKERIEKGNQ